MVFAQTLTTAHHEEEGAAAVNGGNPTAAVENDYFPQEELAGAVWVLRFSKDGKYLATGGQDCVLRVWQVIGHNTADLNQTDHETRAGVTQGESIKVFEDKPVREYEGHLADILDVSWSKVKAQQLQIHVLAEGNSHFFSIRTTFCSRVLWIRP
jgi:WD40 repeat protein